MDKLKVIRSAIQRLEAMYECNHEVMEPDDVGDLVTTIFDLKKMTYEYHQQEYISQLRQFMRYLSDFAGAEDFDTFNDWTKIPYTISHGDKSVTIGNSAETYDYLMEMLQNEVENFE